MTKHRRLISDIIMLSMEHMSAEEIYMKAKEIQPSIAVGTVYRNLSIMTDAGEIRRISMKNSPDRYDKSIIPHEHIICLECGALSDIAVPNLKEYIQKQTGVDIIEYDLNLKYICDKCKISEV